MANKLMELLAEANRRRVFRTAGVYLVAVWGISSGGVDVAGIFGIPEEYVRLSMIAALACLPGVLILAWMFDIGRAGVVRAPQDVEAERLAEDDLAAMPTIVGGDLGAGAIVVRWTDTQGENALLYLEEFFLGRGTDCRVRFFDPLISRRHARIFHEEGVWYIEDLGSRNGTHVDENRIERMALADSSVVRLNEAGPELQIELVRSGAAMRSALETYPPGQATAHVRSPSVDLSSTIRLANRKK